MTNQQGAPEALRRAQYLTVVYRDIKPGDEARELLMHPKTTAASWSHVMNERDRLAALVEAQQPAPSAAVALSDDLRDRLVAISEAVADQDDRAAQAMLREILKAPQPSPTPQADSQPAPDERDDFEKVFPLPSGCIRCGAGYASTGYSNWAAHTHVERWKGWQARAASAPADSVTAPAGGANWAQLRSALAMLMLGWGRNPNQTMDACYRVLDSATEPGTALAILRTAPDWRSFMAADRAKADSVLEDAALTFTSTHIDYVARYGGRCRDCADESGVCPGSGLPCADSRKAIKHVFDALEYGVKNGFIKSPVTARKQGGAT